MIEALHKIKYNGVIIEKGERVKDLPEQVERDLVDRKAAMFVIAPSVKSIKEVEAVAKSEKGKFEEKKEVIEPDLSLKDDEIDGKKGK